jgi:serine phosphatase RsbU (regulator of sigma subunit)
LDLSKEINELERIKQAYGALSDLYVKTGNSKEALANYKFFISYKDSLINEENTKKTTRIEMNYEFDKKEAANKLEQEKKEEISVAERKKQQIIIWSVCAILILVLCFAIFVYRSFLQKQKSHIEITHQKHIIEEKQNSILDSIHYAKRIQTALITSEKYIDRNLNRLLGNDKQNLETSFDTKNFFIFYQPKDIVSGDFYYALAHHHPESDVEKLYLCAADCTGHGVPGAFMSMLNISYLNESIIEKKIVNPNLVLDLIRDEIIASLNPEGSEEESKDGMDCILCAFDFTNNILEYAAANNSFYIVRNGLLISCAADKMPVGKHSDMRPFALRTVQLEKGDIVYLLTDGYADQFGGPKGKKFKYKPLEQLLVSNYKLPMDEQKEILNKNFEVWKGNLEQVDDVLLIGIRV